MSERVLHLTLKGRWFDMILTGDKKEEYRALKPFWLTRILNNNHPDGDNIVCENILFDLKSHDYRKVLRSYYLEIKHFDFIIFKNGYSKNAREMKVECNGIHIGKPAFKWYGAETSEDVFVISLGNIVETKNI